MSLWHPPAHALSAMIQTWSETQSHRLHDPHEMMLTWMTKPFSAVHVIGHDCKQQAHASKSSHLGRPLSAAHLQTLHGHSVLRPLIRSLRRCACLANLPSRLDKLGCQRLQFGRRLLNLCRLIGLILAFKAIEKNEQYTEMTTITIISNCRFCKTPAV